MFGGVVAVKESGSLMKLGRSNASTRTRKIDGKSDVIWTSRVMMRSGWRMVAGG